MKKIIKVVVCSDGIILRWSSIYTGNTTSSSVLGTVYEDSQTLPGINSCSTHSGTRYTASTDSYTGNFGISKHESWKEVLTRSLLHLLVLRHLKIAEFIFN
jgi:hypothetical protein